LNADKGRWAQRPAFGWITLTYSIQGQLLGNCPQNCGQRLSENRVAPDQSRRRKRQPSRQIENSTTTSQARQCRASIKPSHRSFDGHDRHAQPDDSRIYAWPAGGYLSGPGRARALADADEQALRPVPARIALYARPRPEVAGEARPYLPIACDRSLLMAVVGVVKTMSKR